MKFFRVVKIAIQEFLIVCSAIQMILIFALNAVEIDLILIHADVLKELLMIRLTFVLVLQIQLLF